MLGSAASVANPNIVLNTAVAESLRQLSEKLKDVAPEDMETAVHKLLKETIQDHKRIIFNGNGYTDEWVKEAQRRGLYNLKATPDALPFFISDKNVKLLTNHKIFTKEEIHSRYEIWLENYAKTINIESNTMAEMVYKDILPCILSYMEQLANTACLKKSVAADISTDSEAVLIKRLTRLQNTILEETERLKEDTLKANSYEDILSCSKAFETTVLTDMARVRKAVDEAETLLPESLLPYPAYDKLLFSV